jgi:hypothetical protein
MSWLVQKIVQNKAEGAVNDTVQGFGDEFDQLTKDFEKMKLYVYVRWAVIISAAG